ncbi:NIL domain-containing protein [Spirochaetota bacterium]
MQTKEIELSFPGDLKEEPIFYKIIKEFNVIPIIYEASFSTDMGWAILKIKGEKSDLDRLFVFFSEKNIGVNVR